MNILFFLIPKSEVTYVYDDFTILQTLDILERCHYSAIPVINKNGKYIGTLTEGDMLWAIKNEFSFTMSKIEKVSITQIPRKKDHQPVKANANMEDLVSKAMNQNFVPVVDDDGTFIGIITRKDVIQYCYTHFTNQNNS